MAGYQAGSAWISVSPSLRNFHKQVRQQLAKEFANPIEIPVKPDADWAPIKQQATKQGADAGGGFARAFRTRVDAALKQLPEIHVGADTSEADTEIAGLRTRLQALRDLRIGVDIDAAEAQREIAEIGAQLQRLSTDDARVDVQADTAAASAQLAAISGQADRLDGREVNIDVNADRDGSASRSLIHASSQISGLVLAGGLIAPALVPAFGAAAVAAGGLASAISAAGIGIGGLIASVIPAFSNIADVMQAQEAAGKSAATTAVQSSQQRVNAAYQAEQAARSVADAQLAADRAATDSARRVADAQEAADRTAIDGARRVADAREDVARAHERAADIIAAAERRVADAARTVADAQEAELDAQQELTEARKDAIRTLRDLRELVSDLARDEEGAQLAIEQAQLDLAELMNQGGGTAVEAANVALADAQANLNALQSSGSASALELAQAHLAVSQANQQLNAAMAAQEQLALDQAQANHDLAEAQDNLSDIQQEQTDAQQALNEAEQQGIDGMPGVVAAQEALADASQGVADALQSQQDAQGDLADAQVEAAEAVADAQESFALAQEQAAQANADAQRDISRAQEQAARATADAARAVDDALRAQAEGAQQSAAAMAAGSAASNNLAYAMAQLTPMQRELLTGWISLKDAFKAWAEELEPDTIPVFLTGFELLKDLLPLLTPIVKSTAGALKTLLESARDALASPFWQDFFAMLGREAGPQTENFGKIIGNLATGFAGLLKAFAPTARDIGTGLVDWTGKFAEWGKTVDRNDGFQRFIDYVKDQWPNVKRVFSELSGALKNLVESLAPLAGPTLAGIVGLLGVIADMDPQALAAIVGGLTGIGIAIKAMGVAAAFNPVVLIAGAIAGLAYWMIYTYQTSETFRDVVNAVFGAVWTAIKAVFNWIKDNWKTLLIILTGPIGLAVVAIISHWDTIKAGISAAWNWLVTWVFNPVKTFFTEIIPNAAGDLKDGVMGAFNGLMDGLGAAKDWISANVIEPVKGFFQSLWDKAVDMKDGIVGAFEAIPDLVAGFFGGIWDAIKGPLNTVFGWINDYMIKPLNFILNPFDIDIPDLPKLHVGGYVDGTGEKPYMLLGGEGVLNPAATKAFGGKSAIDAANKGIDPTAMGGPFGFDWPDWANWDAVQQGLAIGAEIATGNTAGDALEAGLLKALEGVVSTVEKGLGAVITGPQFVDIPIEHTIHDFNENLLRWAKFGHANIEAPKAPGGSAFFQGDMAFPLPKGSYRVGSPYGPRGGGFHNGWDFPAAVGTPVFAPFSGFLTAKNAGNRSYGKYADIMSGAMRSIQAHLSANVGSNRFVQAGQLVGRVGSTGNSTGPHLHQTFEVNGSSVNPRKYLQFDSGGNLPQGLTLAFNGTGQKERILDPAETRAYESQSSAPHVEMHTYGTPRGLANEIAMTLATRRQAFRPLVNH